MAARFLCALLRNPRIRSNIIRIEVMGDIVTVSMRIPQEYKDVIACISRMWRGVGNGAKAGG